MGADGPSDACRPVVLPLGETVRLRAAAALSPREVALVGEVVEAARARFAVEHPADPSAADLYARLDAARRSAGLSWRQLGRVTGVGAPVLSRLAQGVLPPPGLVEVLEGWLGCVCT